MTLRKKDVCDGMLECTTNNNECLSFTNEYFDEDGILSFEAETYCIWGYCRQQCGNHHYYPGEWDCPPNQHCAMEWMMGTCATPCSPFGVDGCTHPDGCGCEKACADGGDGYTYHFVCSPDAGMPGGGFCNPSYGEGEQGPIGLPEKEKETETELSNDAPPTPFTTTSGLFNPLTPDEIIYKVFSYELDYYIPYYEEERSGGFDAGDSANCTDCVEVIPPQVETPRVLISAPHATSQYRSGGSQWYWSYNCGITPEECASATEQYFDMGHDTGCCGKEPDHYTGALARVVAEITGAPAILQVRKDLDPNYFDTSDGDVIYYKQRLVEIIQQYPTIEIVIDFHGADEHRPFDIDMGTGGQCWIHTAGFSSNCPSLDVGSYFLIDPETGSYMTNPDSGGMMTSNGDMGFITEKLVEIGNFFGINEIVSNHTFSGWYNNSVIKFISGNTDAFDYNYNSNNKRPAIQLEINETYRTDVDGYSDIDWRFNEPYGNSWVNDNLNRMVNTLSWLVQYVQTGEEPGYSLGDVNQDDMVNVLDIMMMIDLIINQTPGWEQDLAEQYPLADINGDGIVDIFDIMSLMNILINDPNTPFSDVQELKRQLIRLDGGYGNNTINVEDVKRIIDMLSSRVSGSEIAIRWPQADIDNDGIVTAMDINNLIQVMMSSISNTKEDKDKLSNELKRLNMLYHTNSINFD